MKIWIINHYATPPDQGSSTRHYSLARELYKLNHEVTVIASATQHLLLIQNKANCQFSKLWFDGYVKFLLLSTPSYQGNGIQRLWNMLFFCWQVLKLPKQTSDKPDIIIGSSVHPFAAWSAERLAKHYRVPFCFEVRDIWPKSLVDMKVIGANHPLVLALSFLEKYLYKRAQKIITLLPFAHEHISQFGIPVEKVVYLPNGVDLDSFSLINSSHVTKESLVVMYLGSHGFANGLSTILDAAAQLNQEPCSVPIVWRFIGDGPCKPELQKKIKNLSLHNVKLENSIPKCQVPTIILEADVLIVNLLNLDIYKYGISLNKLFDYLASQRPIVFGCSARNNPVAEANAGITVPPEDPKAMAHAILHLASMPYEERLQMGIRGRRYVEEHHSYTVLAKKLEALLQQIVKE